MRLNASVSYDIVTYIFCASLSRWASAFLLSAHSSLICSNCLRKDCISSSNENLPPLASRTAFSICTFHSHKSKWCCYSIWRSCFACTSFIFTTYSFRCWIDYRLESNSSLAAFILSRATISYFSISQIRSSFIEVIFLIRSSLRSLWARRVSSRSFSNSRSVVWKRRYAFLYYSLTALVFDYSYVIVYCILAHSCCIVVLFWSIFFLSASICYNCLSSSSRCSSRALSSSTIDCTRRWYSLSCCCVNSSTREAFYNRSYSIWRRRKVSYFACEALSTYMRDYNSTRALCAFYACCSI